MQKYPIEAELESIKTRLKEHNRLILQAPPGAGKTTIVPLALLNEAWLGNKTIIMLQPRRIAVRNAAKRLSSLLGEPVGQTVGYQIRQEQKISKHSRILLMTEGILLRKLQADAELANTALLIFDEFHERNLDADLALALCLQSQQILNEQLKLMIMSATLDAQNLADKLANCPVICSQGRSYPVQTHYHQLSRSQESSSSLSKRQLKRAFTTLKAIILDSQSNCLVFLPGVAEINELYRQLDELIVSSQLERIQVFKLHGNLDTREQNLAISPVKDNSRKVVLATNIAEASITIDSIDCVIDSGLERVMLYNPATGLNRLSTQFISAQSAEQRCGRAGRTRPGACYRLWSESENARLNSSSKAEILYSDLSSLMLQLANWGVSDINELEWIDTPAPASSEHAKQILHSLNAIEEQGKITPQGKQLLQLGYHPRLAHMIISAEQLGQGYQGCLLAALITEKDIFYNKQDRDFDIATRLKALLAYINHPAAGVKHINTGICKNVVKTADELFKRLQSITAQSRKTTADLSLTGLILAQAYPDRIARRRGASDARYLLSSGTGAVIPESIRFSTPEFLVVTHLNQQSGDSLIYQASEISEMQIRDNLPQSIVIKTQTQWNAASQKVDAYRSEYLGQIVLSKTPLISDSETQENILDCLLQGIRKTGIEALNWSTEAIEFVNRMRTIAWFGAEHPELNEVFPIEKAAFFSTPSLLANLDTWLRPFLKHENSIKQCQKIDLLAALSSQLNWQETQRLDQLAPKKIKVPSQSMIRIDYSNPKQPVLAVRLQEVFGMQQTPNIVSGLCPVMIHLLNPARRPVQITQDLASFWSSTYAEVRKELKGRYPKHYWPEDPLQANSTNKLS